MARTFESPPVGQNAGPIPKSIASIQMVDGSSSMGIYNMGRPTKWESSVRGVQKHVTQARDLNFKSISTVVFSSDSHPCEEINWNKDPKTFIFNPIFPRGNTPLYRYMETYMKKALKDFKEDQVLFSIYTDGEDNKGFGNRDTLDSYIRQFVERKWTITFIGLKKDVQNILKVFPMLDKSNTLEVENTGESYEQAFETYAVNTASYTKSVNAGEDVTTGFFKSIQNQD